MRTALAPAAPQRLPRWHPGEDQLKAFMRSELSRSEVMTVVRHLIPGCTHCLAVTRRLWELGEGR